MSYLFTIHTAFVWSFIQNSVLAAFREGSTVDVPQIELIARLLNEDEHAACYLYTHLYLAYYYNLMCIEDMYSYHYEKAVSLAIMRGWYAILAEFSYTMDWSRLKAINIEAYNRVNELSKPIIENNLKNGYLSSFLPSRSRISVTEIKIASMLAQNRSNEEIADTLDITLYRVKETVKKLYAYSDTTNRQDLSEYIRSAFRISYGK